MGTRAHACLCFKGRPTSHRLSPARRSLPSLCFPNGEIFSRGLEGRRRSGEMAGPGQDPRCPLAPEIGRGR